MAIVDTYYSYRFIKLLTTPWKDTKAYKLGIIDAKGTLLKPKSSLKTTAEKDAYTFFHTLVYNIKKLIAKMPGGNSRLATYSSALFLLKEMNEAGMLDKFVEENEPTNVTGGIAQKDCPLEKPLKRKKKKKEKIKSFSEFVDDVNEGRVIKRVVRNNKVVKKVKCTNPNQRVKDGKCVSKDSTFKRIQRLSAKKRVRSLKGKSKNASIRKRAKSMRKVK